MYRFTLAVLLALVPAVALAQPDWGTFPDGGTLYFYTNTVGTDGVAETIVGETIAVYKDGSDTQLTTGASINDDADTPSVTGFHRITIDTTQSGFDAGSHYTVVYTAGTVDAVSVAGRVIGSFKLGVKVTEFGATSGELELKKVVLPHQSDRLKLIDVTRIRQRGAAALSNRDLASALGLSDEQRENLQQRSDEIQTELREKMRQLQSEARNKMLEGLTPEQRVKLEQLVGDNFELTPGGLRFGEDRGLREDSQFDRLSRNGQLPGATITSQ